MRPILGNSLKQLSIFLWGPESPFQVRIQALGPTVDQLHGVSSFHKVDNLAVWNMVPNTHLLDQLGEHVVFLFCPLLAFQGFVVLLEFLQALEGTAACLPKAKQK